MSYTVIPNDSDSEPRSFPFAIVWNKQKVAWCESEQAANNLLEDLNALTKEAEEAQDRETGRN